jgi:hypothetical protein
VWHWTIRCNKKRNGSNGQLLQTLTDALTWRAPDNEQWLSGAPIASKLHQRLGSGWGYKHPQPPHSKQSKFSENPIHCKSKRLHSKTHPIDQILSKPPNQLNSIRDLRECVLCSFVSLVAWIGLFFFPSYSQETCKRSKRHQVCGGPCGV